MTPIDRLLAICSLPAGDEETYDPLDLVGEPEPIESAALTYGCLRELAKLHQELTAENERLNGQATAAVKARDTVRQWERHDWRRRNEHDWQLVDDLLSDLREDLGEDS